MHLRSDITVFFSIRSLLKDDVSLGGYATTRMCSVVRTALVKIENDGFDHQVLAHEFAHTVGAPHDGDEPCEGEASSGWLMGARFSPATRFSQCSIAHIQKAIAQFGDCLARSDMALAAEVEQTMAMLRSQKDPTVPLATFLMLIAGGTARLSYRAQRQR